MSEEQAPTDGGENGKIDRIREILFGAQAQDFQARLSELDETLSQSIDSSRKELGERIDQLGERLQADINGLRKAFEQRRDEVDDRLGRHETSAAEQRQELERRIRTAAQDGDSAHQRLETQVNELIRDAQNRVDEGLSNLRQRMNKQFDAVRASKTDRLRLAQLLAEVSAQLADEGTGPTE